MSRYRRILVRIWEDDKFPFLPPDHQRLFLYHLTSPRSTPFLLYVEGPGAIGDALRMPSGRLREGMIDLSQKGMVWYSGDGSNLLHLPNALMLPENAPASLNAVKAWEALFRDLPNTPFRNKCLRHWEGLGLGIEHPLTRAFVKACAKGCMKASPMAPTQEQEQEQLQEQEQKPPSSPPAGDERGFEEFWHAYPRKVGKGAARKSWHKARPPLDTVLAVLARQRTSRDWTKDGGQFIPHPATWLNQERWLDQVAAGDEEDEE